MPSSLVQRVERARIYSRTPEFSKLWRYASVSVISTVMSIGLLVLFLDVAKISSAAWCNLLATSITSVPAYYLNRTWAWGKTGKSHLIREVIPFWVIAIASIILSTGAVRLASAEAHHVTHTHEIVTVIVVGANFLTYAIMWVGKFLLFNRVLFKNNEGSDDPDVGAPGEGYAPQVASTPASGVKTIQAFVDTATQTVARWLGRMWPSTGDAAA